MLRVGITGGIGSGKSTICKLFALLGAPVFDADATAKLVMVTDEQLIKELKKAFGIEVYFEDGTLNRGYLAAAVFNDAEQLALLNSIVHPATFRAYDAWADTHKNNAYIVKEAALLFETEAHKRNDINIMITAPEHLRIQRAMLRDGTTEEQIRDRMQHQLPEQVKVQRADYVIYNTEEELVIPQVLALHQQFSSK